MDIVSADLIELFMKLLPGFLAAAAFHALTPYPKRDVFERVVTALIFTLLAQLATFVVETIAIWIGDNGFTVGPWSQGVELAWAAAVGLLMGVGWAYLVNNDHTHSLARRLGITKKSAVPTQWYSAFTKYECFVILQFTNGRRLMGWPVEWPDDAESGHFVLERPQWVLDDGSAAPMHQLEVLLISAKDVEAVEFLRFSDDRILVEQAAEIQKATDLLVATRKGSRDEQSEKPQ